MIANILIDNLINGMSPTARYKDRLQAIAAMLNSSMKFDFGETSNVPVRIGQRIEIPKLPYQLMYCELKDYGRVFGVLLYDSGSEGIVGEIFMQIEGVYGPLGISILTFNENRVQLRPCEEIPKEIAKNFISLSRPMLGGIFQLINVMNCSNVILVDNVPSRFKQQRISKKKTPLFEYKTLHIHQNRTVNKHDGGGTHASPRVHLRRGHIRKLPTGDTTWVQSCVVGNKEHGIVHKDYRVHVH